MPRPLNSRSGGRPLGGRSMRGATPAQRSRYMDDAGILQAPNLERYGGPVPNLVKLPSLVEMKGMSVEQLSAVLDRFGITDPWPQQRAAQVGYLNRFSQFPAGSPQYNEALDKLLDFESEQGLLMAARRAYHEYSAASFGGNARLVRIGEDDDSSCDRCIELSGFEGTIDEQRSVGWVGAASCSGSDRCRCEYVEVE